MNKTLIISLLVLLSGCATKEFYPYTGNIEVTGEGGFITDIIVLDDIPNHSQFFFGEQQYAQSEVTFFLSGLPENKKCYLLGAIQHSGNKIDMAEFILKLGGNVATKSGVSMPLKLDKDKGVLSNSLEGSTTIYTVNSKEFGSITTIEHVYNVFDCEE